MEDRPRGNGAGGRRRDASRSPRPPLAVRRPSPPQTLVGGQHRLDVEQAEPGLSRAPLRCHGIGDRPARASGSRRRGQARARPGGDGRGCRCPSPRARRKRDRQRSPSIPGMTSVASPGRAAGPTMITRPPARHAAGRDRRNWRCAAGAAPRCCRLARRRPLRAFLSLRRDWVAARARAPASSAGRSDAAGSTARRRSSKPVRSAIAARPSSKSAASPRNLLTM